jgi:hypothetical protein
MLSFILDSPVETLRQRGFPVNMVLSNEIEPPRSAVTVAPKPAPPPPPGQLGGKGTPMSRVKQGEWLQSIIARSGSAGLGETVVARTHVEQAVVTTCEGHDADLTIVPGAEVLLGLKAYVQDGDPAGAHVFTQKAEAAK